MCQRAFYYPSAGIKPAIQTLFMPDANPQLDVLVHIYNTYIKAGYFNNYWDYPKSKGIELGEIENGTEIPYF